MATQNQRIVRYLSTGKNLSERFALSNLGVENLRARIDELRAAGFPVYTNTNKNGTTVYRLGRPTREMIAAAYRSLGGRAFS